jgi:putative membrane protein
MSTSIRCAIIASTIAACAYIGCGSNGGDASDNQQASITGVPSGDGGQPAEGGTSGDGGVSGEGGRSADGGAGAAPTPGAPVVPVNPTLAICSDGQSAAILQAANQAEVDLANAVSARLTDPNVQAFAQRMITDHTNANQALAATLSSTGIAPIPNGLSSELTAAATVQVQALAPMTGQALERAYINGAVLDHLTVLNLMDRLLTPSIKNAQLANVAAQGRAAVADHTVLATQVQTAIEGSCGGNAAQ